MAQTDPVVKSGRREAVLSLGLWLLATVYSVTFCYLFGYDVPVGEMSFILWFPDWVFWGIVVPWVVCAVVSTWFAFHVMTDEPLGAESQPSDDDEDPLA